MPAYRLFASLTAVALVTACSASGPDASRPPRPTATGSTTPAPDPLAALPQPEKDERLLTAAAGGSTEEVARLVAAGADTETRDERKRTPLLLAATRDRVGAAEALVAAGADPDALDDRHDTPWLVTGVTGSVEMAKVLLPAGPDLTVRNRFGGVSHIPASERGHDDYVSFVLANTAIAVDHVNDLGWTALLEAVILGKGTGPWQRIVQALVDAGADVSVADRDGVTPLQHAQRQEFVTIERILSRV